MIRILALLLVCLAVSMASAAEPPRTCDTPYNATVTTFGWLQPDLYNPALAATCLDPRGRTPEELRTVAKHIKEVYDAKALYVQVDAISQESDWTNPDTEQARFAPHKELPNIVIARQPDGRWLWTKPSLDHIETLHAETFALLDDTTIEQLPSWLRTRIFGIEFWQYLSLLLIFMMGLVVRKIAGFVIAGRIQAFAVRFGQDWASNVISLLSAPAATLIMGGILWLAYPVLRLPVEATVALNVAIRSLIIFSVVWAAYRMIDVIAEVFTKRAEGTDTKLDDQLVPLLSKSFKVITIVAGSLLVLQNLNVNVASLLAGLGIGGLAFAFAAQDTLANFFGSIMIFLDHPFQIGDWIVMGESEGVVEEVGFRSTRIRTFYNSIICVPNSKFTANPIDNYGVRRYRRTFTTLNLTYDTTPEQMQAFVEGIRAILKANPHTRKDYYEIHMSGFGSNSLNVMVYFFFEVPSWTDELRERHNVFLEIMRLARQLNVSFAFPTSTVHIEQLPEPGPRAIPPVKTPEELGDIVTDFGPGGNRSRPAGPKITNGYFAGKE